MLSSTLNFVLQPTAWTYLGVQFGFFVYGELYLKMYVLHPLEALFVAYGSITGPGVLVRRSSYKGAMPAKIMFVNMPPLSACLVGKKTKQKKNRTKNETSAWHATDIGVHISSC